MRWTRSHPYLRGRDSQAIISLSLATLAVLNPTHSGDDLTCRRPPYFSPRHTTPLGTAQESMFGC